MTFTQVITPNPEVPCTPRWCLTYVDHAFNLKAHGKTKNYLTALDAWGASKSQHRDRNFPANRWVPVWFTLKNEPAGHVAILAPDGAVWSSSHPTSNQPVRHASLDDIIKYYGTLGLTFIGWTEDVGGVAVIKEGEDMIQDTDHEYTRWANLSKFVRGRSNSKKELVPLTRDEFRKSAVGKTWLKAVEILMDDQEAHKAIAALNLGVLAREDNWEGQIHSLIAQLKATPADTGEAEEKLQKLKESLKDVLDIK